MKTNNWCAPWRLFYLLLACCLSSLATAQVSSINLPPNAELSYQIKSSQKGIPISGEARVIWTSSGTSGGLGNGFGNLGNQSKPSYRVQSDTRVPIFGRILSSSSEGDINEQGLAPVLFKEKRLRKAESQTRFDRERKLISFSDSDLQYPIKGGEQDRLSATWQLVTLLRSQPQPLKVGQEWHFFVAGLKDADPWRFTLLDHSKQRTALGEFDVIHLLKAPPADARGQRVELWLAPELDFYPVRISFHDENGDDLDQRLLAIKKLLP